MPCPGVYFFAPTSLCSAACALSFYRENSWAERKRFSYSGTGVVSDYFSRCCCTRYRCVECVYISTAGGGACVCIGISSMLGASPYTFRSVRMAASAGVTQTGRTSAQDFFCFPSCSCPSAVRASPHLLSRKKFVQTTLSRVDLSIRFFSLKKYELPGILAFRREAWCEKNPRHRDSNLTTYIYM